MKQQTGAVRMDQDHIEVTGGELTLRLDERAATAVGISELEN